MTRLSLVVPTLRRADTLRHTLETLVAQTGADVEIVVQNNGGDPDTATVVEAIADPRIRLFGSRDVLPMAQNWERALDNCTGDYVTFLGDDDALLPDACDIAQRFLDDSPTELLSWRPFLYFWPNHFDPLRRNRLQATLTFEFVVRPHRSRSVLERVYAFEDHYSELPMIYNSFVARSLIDRVRRRHGAYFFGSSPDVTSGVVNAATAESFLLSSRALSIAGLSRHSSGARYTQRETIPTAEELARDFPLLSDDEIFARSANLELGIAADLAYLKEHVLREDQGIELSRRGLVRSVAAAINNNPTRYDETIGVLQGLAERFGVDLETIWIPPRLERPTPLRPGLHRRGPGEAVLVVDGDEVGLESIADAARLGGQLVPRVGDARLEPLRASVDPPTVGPAPLSFARDGDAVGALRSGWSEPEEWGTWSIDRASVLVFDAPAAGRFGRTRVGIRYRSFPFPDGTLRLVRCELDGAALGVWELSEANAAGELVVELPRSRRGGVVELVVANPNVRSPAELGLGPDTRPLGIGIETIRLIA